MKRIVQVVKWTPFEQVVLDEDGAVWSRSVKVATTPQIPLCDLPEYLWGNFQDWKRETT